MRHDTMKLCWYMRGSISYVDAMNMSFTERGMINDIIKDNLETTKKTGLPFF